MANTVIQLKHSTLTGNVPSSLANGEISINNRDGKFFYSTPAGIVTTHYPYLGPAGLNKEVQFNDSGILGSNAGLAFDKVSGSLNVSNAIIVNGRNLDAYANAAFLQANTPSYTANSAASYANSAFAAANSGSGSSSAGPYANAAFAVANSSSSYANAAFLQANTPSYLANSAGSYANSAFNLTNSIYFIVNSAAYYANTGFSAANSASSYANAAFLAANSGSGSSSAGPYANAAFAAANAAAANTSSTSFAEDTFTANGTGTTFVLSTSANQYTVLVSVNGVLQPNLAYTVADTTLILSEAPSNLDTVSVKKVSGASSLTYIIANTSAASSYANSAFAAANTGSGSSSAGPYANAAFARANNSLSANVGGTVSGDVIITGNLTIQGTSFTANAGILTSNDTMFILGIGNYTADVLDLGFAAHYNSGTNAHSGLIRDSVTKEWYLFKDYTPEIGANNNIDINDASFSIDTLSANVKSTTITLRGVDLLGQVNNAYQAANTPSSVANSAALYANSAFAAANSVATTILSPFLLMGA